MHGNARNCRKFADCVEWPGVLRSFSELCGVVRKCAELQEMHGIVRKFRGDARICADLLDVAWRCLELRGIARRCAELFRVAIAEIRGVSGTAQT